MRICKECGREIPKELNKSLQFGIESHHIVPKSEVLCKAIKDIKFNRVDLCYNCHQGSSGIHHNKEMEDRYKLELQNLYYDMFPEGEVTEKQIIERLGITRSKFNKLYKHLHLSKNGFEKERLIMVLMGGGFC